MITVIFLGNPLRGDDGIGPAVYQKMKTMNNSGTLRLIESGGDAFGILEYLIDRDPVVIVDCARMGQKPGEIVKFFVNDENLSIIEKNISLHGFGFGEIYRLAKSMGEIVSCTLIGIEPESIEFNQGLSNTVKSRIPKIINMVIEEAKKNA